MDNSRIEIRETAVGTLSGYLVGVSNIWERELPDEKGDIALRLSARLSIMDSSSDHLHYLEVFAGSVVVLGSDRYLVENVEEGITAPGAIVLQKLVQ